MRLSLVLAALALAPQVHAEDWVSLFDGKSLAGWRANTSLESFTVVDGTIRVRAVGRVSSHLFYVGDTKDGLEQFRNFELEAMARAEPNSNSGIFIHTDLTPRPGAASYLANGYEVQLNSSTKEKRKTGSLYQIVDLAKSPVDETKWFKVTVKVEGQRITIALDGKQVVDYTEPAGVKRPEGRTGRVLRAGGGAIALQAHDPQSVWYFKDIRVKRLPKTQP